MTSRPQAKDLSALTGVRSGKRSYYKEYRRSDERTRSAVQAMDSISRAIVRTVEGPRGLLEEVVRAAASHLNARWMLLALADDQLPLARPRFLVMGRSGPPTSQSIALPEHVRFQLAAIRAGDTPTADERWVRVPMILEGDKQVGVLAGAHELADEPEPDDLAVLRILANQAAVSLHTSEQYQAGMTMHRRAQRLYDEATAYARDLETRTAQLRLAETQLAVAQQRELIDTERHRIARELHDSVTQFVLSAGMSVEMARGEAEVLGDDAAAIHDRLATAKDLSQQAVEQLRRAIYALEQPHRDTVSPLPELLSNIAAHHRSHLAVELRVKGEVVSLPAGADHEIARAVGEALFNVAAHANATRVVIRLRYRPDELLAAVADDGGGDPSQLSRLLRLERRATGDGRHRGLANIESRIADLGGTVQFRRARLGGVRVQMRVPLPISDRPGNDLINQLSGAGETDDDDAH